MVDDSGVRQGDMLFPILLIALFSRIKQDIHYVVRPPKTHTQKHTTGISSQCFHTVLFISIIYEYGVRLNSKITFNLLSSINCFVIVNIWNFKKTLGFTAREFERLVAHFSDTHDQNTYT